VQVKNIGFYIIACTAILCTSFNSTQKTIHDYNIFVAGMKVGSLKASKEVDGPITTYNLNSEVSVFLLHKYHIKDELNAVYRNNILVSAYAKTTEGKRKYVSSIVWDNNHYNVDIDAYHYSRKYSEINQIQFTVARIYFEEPPASARIYSEVYGLFSNIETLRPHEYQMIFNGKKNTFSYTAREMIRAEIQNPVKEFVMVRVF
jgi:hypothetical protein